MGELSALESCCDSLISRAGEHDEDRAQDAEVERTSKPRPRDGCHGRPVAGAERARHVLNATTTTASPPRPTNARIRNSRSIANPGWVRTQVCRAGRRAPYAERRAVKVMGVFGGGVGHESLNVVARDGSGSNSRSGPLAVPGESGCGRARVALWSRCRPTEPTGRARTQDVRRR